MQLEELTLLRNQGLSEDEIEKLKIVLAFYDRLPSEVMQEELLVLMERQPFMRPEEFNVRLDDFALRVKAAGGPTQYSGDMQHCQIEIIH